MKPRHVSLLTNWKHVYLNFSFQSLSLYHSNKNKQIGRQRAKLNYTFLWNVIIFECTVRPTGNAVIGPYSWGISKFSVVYNNILYLWDICRDDSISKDALTITTFMRVNRDSITIRWLEDQVLHSIRMLFKAVTSLCPIRRIYM